MGSHKDSSSMEIRKLQEILKDVQEAYVAYLDAKCKTIVKEKLEGLNKSQQELDVMPEPPKVSVDLETCSEVEIAKLKHDVKKYVRLLEIFTIKLNCPMSKVIDRL